MWQTLKLSDIVDISIGKTPPRGDKRYWDREKDTKNIWLSIADMNSATDGFVSDSKEYVSNAGAALFKPVPAGTLIMSFKLSIGKLAFTACELRTNEAIAALEIKNENQITKEYLKHFLSSRNWDKIAGDDAKVKGKTLNKAKLKELEVVVPPLAEQHRIVAKLDAAFDEIDKAIINIEGKERSAEKIYLNGIDAHFKEMSAATKTSKLLELTSKIGSGATPKGGRAAYKTEGISLIRSMNVHDMQFKWKDLAKIDDAQADSLSNVEICKNDVLLNITGASVARCCVVEEAALPARVNQHVAIIRPLENTVLPNYLAYLLVSKTYKDLLLSVGEGGGATRQAITKAEIEQFRISYPSSIDEQASSVRKFDNLREQALQLKAIYTKQIKNFQSLKSAILADELQSEAA